MKAKIQADPFFLDAVLFSPHTVLERLLDAYSSPDTGPVDSWLAMAWTAEAAWSAVAGGLPAEAGYAAGDDGLLRPLAARLRFLVLSEPSRWRDEKARGWWARPPDRTPGGNRVVNRAFGPESWHELMARCLEARRVWQGCLDEYQSHPVLAHAKPRELEQELCELVFRHGRTRLGRQAAAPLGLSEQPLADSAPLTAEDSAVIAEVAERHLLPRFAWLTAARLTLYDDHRVWRWARRVSGLAAIGASLAAVGYAATLHVRCATISALICYGLLCVGVVVLPQGWGSMWLLRMPAASAVGIIALISLLAGGLLHTTPAGWRAAAALAAVSLGYLLIEVRNHGVGSGMAMLRALLVAGIGAIHALMVSLIGLVVVAPAFLSDGAGLEKLWSRPAYGQAGLTLALAASWCLAVGVFSQILWDDRPITAPLAHLGWRSRP
ncbi:MAG TPA: hypothetical protein VFQ68_45820 [Streptosporangiaceae bacterium]|nr:hypothetical protein [Streptosporangiaceae bacterium]